jgi:Domain of unknown function (DUF5668)
MGPAIVITIGLLFLLSEMRGGDFDFSNTYPVILIVIGAISLAAALAPTDGHVSSSVAPPPASGPIPPQAPASPSGIIPGPGR